MADVTTVHPTHNADGKQTGSVLVKLVDNGDGTYSMGTASAGSGTTADKVQGNVASGAADSGNPVKVGGIHNTNLPTLSAGQRGDAQLDSAGGLYTVIKDVNGSNGADVSNAGADGLDPTSFGGLYTLSFGYCYTGTTMNRVKGGVTTPTATLAGFQNSLPWGVFNAAPTTRTEGQGGPLQTTSAGALVSKPYAEAARDWNYAAAASGIVNTTTAVTVKAAGAAGIRNYVTGIQVMAEALGTATELAVRDGAGGTVLWRTKIGTGGLTDGLSISFPSPLKGTAATLLEVVTLTASGTGAVYVNLQGYEAP